jgi:hypothetical protein
VPRSTPDTRIIFAASESASLALACAVRLITLLRQCSIFLVAEKMLSCYWPNIPLHRLGLKDQVYESTYVQIHENRLEFNYPVATTYVSSIIIVPMIAL